MKKALKIFGLVVVVTALAVTIAIPLAVPPVVKRLAEEKLAQFGYPCNVQMHLEYGWRKGPELGGSLRVALPGTPWRVHAGFGVGLGEWHASVKMAETRFSEEDRLLKRLLAENPLPPTVSNLTFSGSVALDASVERTRSMPVPVWKVSLPVKGLSARLVADETPLSVEGFSVHPAVSGIASHFDVAPAFLRASSVSAGELALTNFQASVLYTGKSLLVNEAGAGFCGGSVHLYSLFLNPESLNAGLTLSLENVNPGEALSRFNGFKGEASGRLNGKVRLFVRNGGKAIRLSEAYLYSSPGETGKLQMENASAVADNLALAGIDEDSRANVANALTDLDYSVLKVDLKRGSGRSATLTVRIDGSATRDAMTVPVNLTININGELDQLINTGLGLGNLLKGNNP